MNRYISIWFRHFKTDWFCRRQPALRTEPFVLYIKDHGRMIVSAANEIAEKHGIWPGTVLADARAVAPHLQVCEEPPGRFDKTIRRIAEWFIRYSPVVAIDGEDGLLIDASGCAHLWGGEAAYLQHIVQRMSQSGYGVRIAMAGSIGCACACARYCTPFSIVANGKEHDALQSLPPSALRIGQPEAEKLHKLGLRQIGQLVQMPSTTLHRRFGTGLVQRLQQALGYINEHLQPVCLPAEYAERMHFLDPIVTRAGIELTLQQLLQKMCARLTGAGLGLRSASLKGYRIDGKLQSIGISTTRPSADANHLFKLFELKIETIAPGLGIELFVLEAEQTEVHFATQQKFFETKSRISSNSIAQLLDRLANKIGEQNIHRYLPDEHYWPERSYKPATSVLEEPATAWPNHAPRPLRILPQPELINVTAPIPDYPPMNFRHRGVLHKIIKADGPERIEQEWWMQEGLHRDYYYVEDEQGCRYWLYRSGHYDAERPVQWYLHGYCA